MGSTTTTKTAGEKVFVSKPRIASFVVKGEGKERVFTAVNRKAHKIARKAGKRTRLTVAQLRENKGNAKVRVYQDGKLVVARV